jgi:hypothetical protein
MAGGWRQVKEGKLVEMKELMCENEVFLGAGPQGLTKFGALIRPPMCGYDKIRVKRRVGKERKNDVSAGISGREGRL